MIIASMCVCQFISCEIVMPRRLNCCTLFTITGLLAEVSDRYVWRGKFCKRAEDHLLGLHEVYLHFIWGGRGLQLLKECLHVCLL